MEDQKIKAAIERLNERLEENRLAFERIKPLSEQINKELNDNKQQRKEIETELDQYYFQIRQSKLS